MKPSKHYVWDPLVRLFHWSLVGTFCANALFTRPGKITHQWVGYAVAGLIGLRLIWGLVGTCHARFRDFRLSPSGALRQLADMATGRRHAHIGHSPLGALMIYNLLATMAGLAITGYMMTTVAYFGVKWVAMTHETLVTWTEVSIAAHIAAVVLESRRLRVNLPKSMLTGYKSIPHPDLADE